MGDPVSPTAARLRRAVAVVGWAYLAAVLAAWLALRWADEWWPATVLMFSPRWAFALPLAVLVPAAVRWRRRSLGVLVAGAVVVGGPLTGFNVPWPRLTGPAPAGEPFRVMTLNMHYTGAAPIPLDDLILTTNPDVVAVQEWPGAGRSDLKSAPGWHVHSGLRMWLASRHPIRRATDLGHDPMGEQGSVTHYELDTPLGIVHVFSLHTATARQGISDVIRDSGKGAAEVRANSARRREQCAFAAAKAAACRGPVVVVGDFNSPPESPVFREVWGGYTDAFAAAGWGWGYTFVGSKTTVRIDHVLAGPGWRAADCRVGPKVGSPHRPVIADLVWTGPPVAE